MNKRVLITGIGGLVGSNLAKRLIDEGCDVFGIDNFSGGSVNNVPYGCICVYRGDLADDGLVNEIDSFFNYASPEIVYHCAAYAAEGLSPFIRRYNYQNNLVATATIVNNCINHNVGRLVYFSSMAVYGDNKNIPFDEIFLPQPIDPYGIAKYACEMDIKVAGVQHGLEWCIIRPHNVYGPNQNIWDNYRNVLGIWMRKHLNGEPLTIFGTGDQQRAFSYIDDTMLPLMIAGESPDAAYKIINLGSPTVYSINEAADILIDVMGGGEKVYLEGRHEVSRAFSTTKLSEDILQYKETVTLRNGLEKMWEWAKTAEPSKSKQWKSYEVEKNIYDFWKK